MVVRHALRQRLQVIEQFIGQKYLGGLVWRRIVLAVDATVERGNIVGGRGNTQKLCHCMEHVRRLAGDVVLKKKTNFSNELNVTITVGGEDVGLKILIAICF